MLGDRLYIRQVPFIQKVITKNNKSKNMKE